MVIGNGLLGREFKKYNDFNNCIIFASGVSNSNETDNVEFEREKLLLIKIIKENKDMKIIYFSSVLAGITNNKYYGHKIELEELIKKETNNHLIFRIPQVVGNNGNKNNLFNYLITSIINNSRIIIYDKIDRAIIDVDDVVKIVGYCNNKTTGETLFLSAIEKIKVMDLYIKITSFLNKEQNAIKGYTPEGKWLNENWLKDNSVIVNEAINALDISPNGYTDKIINKYIKH
jgi:hypothetical protein